MPAVVGLTFVSTSLWDLIKWSFVSQDCMRLEVFEVRISLDTTELTGFKKLATKVKNSYYLIPNKKWKG